MTSISKTLAFVHGLVFGKTQVKEHHFPRSIRIFRAALKEHEQELGDDPRRALSTTYKKRVPWAERLPDRVCDVLVQEAYQRAAAIEPDGSVRWKGFLSALLSVADVTGQALDGEKIGDLRVKQILEVNRVI